MEDVILSNQTVRTRANRGQARILEAIVAATIIFVAFSASSFFINYSNQTTSTQEKTTLNRLGYNVLSRLTESGTIEATIENQPEPLLNQLRASLQQSLPTSIFFKLTITSYAQPPASNGWVTVGSQQAISNSEDDSFLNLPQTSSTPMIYTSKNGNIYQLVLILANAGEGT